MTIEFIADEKTAFTMDDGIIVRWEPDFDGENRLFISGERKQVLRSDNGSWWLQNRKEAANCWFASSWFGEFPWGSWGIGFMVCKKTGKVYTEGFETEINPRGLTGAELFRRDCQSYQP